MCLSSVLAENKFAMGSGAKTSGDLPQFESCKSISIIDLDRNNLSETIPNSFSKCQALEKLNLSNNNMIGHIPEELASIPILSINGPIPKKFGSSSSFNVSFNNIVGSIPTGKSFKLMGSSAFVGNSETLWSTASTMSWFSWNIGEQRNMEAYPGVLKELWMLLRESSLQHVVANGTYGTVYKGTYDSQDVAGSILHLQGQLLRVKVDKVYISFEEMVAYIANTSIFILSGVVIAEGVLGDDNVFHHGIALDKNVCLLSLKDSLQILGSVEGTSWTYLLLLYVYVQVSRCIVVGALFPLLRYFGYGLDWKEASILIWSSGLQGAVALSLSLSRSSGQSLELTPKTGTLFVFFTGGIVFLTLIVNGSTTQFALHYLDMDKLIAAKKHILDFTKYEMLNKALEAFGELGDDEELREF
ncbi:hypothetical protein Ahy_B08g092418 [Arachis hypogaea]|uniref:Cation/H+ exchanger domain-containing protein n=1 Tax=Arachis hypogaea TaxID=3818 RepID=A0A444Y3Y3_ARAHY|nr:hypothetical protein Ahy_B08g092418 [Arachis hypogaea]